MECKPLLIVALHPSRTKPGSIIERQLLLYEDCTVIENERISPTWSDIKNAVLTSEQPIPIMNSRSWIISKAGKELIMEIVLAEWDKANGLFLCDGASWNIAVFSESGNKIKEISNGSTTYGGKEIAEIIGLLTKKSVTQWSK